MDAIKNNKWKVKKKVDKTKGIMYMSERLNAFIKLYLGSFDLKSLDVLEKLELKEKKIDYKNLCCKILFYDEDNARPHKKNSMIW